MSEATPGALRVGVDIGGTFTDLVFLDAEGHLHKLKTPSTPDDYARAIVEGITRRLGEHEPAARIEEIVHATTVATNAILERSGARTALVTTEGFRDVLELRRIRIPLVYDLSWEKPPPLVERALRFEVTERLDARGVVITPLEGSAVEAIADAIEAGGVEAVAVCLLHAYRDGAHEGEVARRLQARLPGVHLSLSSAVLPEIQEFERTSTTVVNAYVAPLIGRYLGELRRQLAEREIRAPILVMQSNGGLVPASTAADRPVTIIESGPAAGVVAAARAAAEAGYANVITLDMGGTTTKASMIENGGILRARDYEVGGAVSVSSRLVRGSGYLLRIPVIDISEVGAGGGSLARIDAGGALRVGPRSAGAVPGPACYGLGNDRPTVTDANLVIGLLHDGSLAGGSLVLERARAERAIEAHVAGPAGLDLQAAAYGIHLVANSNMVRAIKSVSVERGRDPADFVMMAFGGAGPLHAVGVARALGMRRVVVPPAPGLFSAYGLLRAEVEHHTARTVLFDTSAADRTVLRRVLEEMRADLAARIRAEGFGEEAVQMRALADLRYRGQSSEIMVALASLDPDGAALREAEEAFESEYERIYGHRGDHRVFELVNCHLVATVIRGVEHQGRWPEEALGGTATFATREVYFGPETGSVRTPVLGREALDEHLRPGPLLVQEYDTTIVVPPGCHASRDRHGNVLVDLPVE